MGPISLFTCEAAPFPVHKGYESNIASGQGAQHRSVRRLRGSRLIRAQDAAGERAVMSSALVKHLAVYDRVMNSESARHQAASAARQVMQHLGAMAGINRRVVEDDEVGCVAGSDSTAALDAEIIRGLRSHALDGVLETEQAFVAHPFADQVGGITRITQIVDMRAAVGYSDQRARIAQQFGSDLEQYECVLKLEIVFDRQIEERVEGVPPAFALDVRDGAAFERLHRRVNHFLHGEQVPLAVEDARVLQVFAKGGAEGGIHVVTLLHLDGLIEDPAP